MRTVAKREEGMPGPEHLLASLVVAWFWIAVSLACGIPVGIAVYLWRLTRDKDVD